MNIDAQHRDLPSGLLIGWAKPEARQAAGFTARIESDDLDRNACGDPITYDGEGHLMTIAPTGAGKGVGCVVPALLSHQGQVIALDVKGENYVMTRRHRSEQGSKIVCIDPFGVARRMAGSCEDEISGFNPFDLLPYLSDDRATACRALADMLISPDGHAADPFWRDAAVGVLAGMIDCYDRLPGASRGLHAIVQDLGIEAPDAMHPGEISTRTHLISRLDHDPEFTKISKTLDLTSIQVCAAFEAAGGERPGDYSAIIVKTLVNTAARMGIEAVENGLDLKDSHARSQEAARIASDLAGAKASIKQFTEHLIMQGAVTCPPDLIGQLWRDLSLYALENSHAQMAAGSFADEAQISEVPENYPLALHRVALCPTVLCRSVAAQPYAADKTWGSVLLTLRSEMAQYTGQSIAQCLSGSLDLEAIRRGDNIALYIAFPPGRIRSHRMLFRVMVEGLMSVLQSRVGPPPRRTLMLLDEIAQLGFMDFLVTSKTLLRGYGVQVWSFWQDISQLTANYPKEWRTIMNNCRVIQVFGRSMGGMSSELAQALDFAPGVLTGLKSEDVMAWIDSPRMRILKRAVSYSDPTLAPLCDANPFVVSETNDAPVLADDRPHTQPMSKKSDLKDDARPMTALEKIVHGKPDNTGADELDLF